MALGARDVLVRAAGRKRGVPCVIERRGGREDIRPVAGIAPASVLATIELVPVRRPMASRAVAFRLKTEFRDVAGRPHQGRPSGCAGLLEVVMTPDARRRPMGAVQYEAELGMRSHIGR